MMVNPGIKEGIFIPLLHEHKFADLKVTLIYASKPFQSQKYRNMVQLLRQTDTEEGVISYPK
jgi:hypothetical protein